MNTVLRSASVLALAAAALSANAVPIAYSLTTTASGSLDGSSFTNALVTLSVVSDTSLVTVNSGTYFSTNPTTVTVAGLASDAIASVSATVTPANSFGGFGTSTGPTGLLLAGFSNPAFSGYDLKSAFGPVSGSLLYNSGSSFATTRGSFILNSAGTGTSQARTNPTPEPSALAALGLGSLALLRRRKRA